MVRTLRALGLTKRHQTVCRPNNENIRGALEKVKHLVVVETDAMYESRIAAARVAKALREPIVVEHEIV